MNFIFEWVRDNLASISLVGAGTAIVGIVVHHVKTKMIPMLIDQIKIMVVKVVANLFGIDFGDGNLTDTLPIVKTFDELKELTLSNLEIRLIELKKAIVSPLYTDLEKAALRKEYEILLKKMSISQETKEVLEMYDEIEQEV